MVSEEAKGANVIVSTSRFGKVEISPEDLISFPEGLLGFNDLRKFVILDDPTDDIFAWLQSCEEPKIAFPILEPEIFIESYKGPLTKTDLDALGLKDTNAQGLRYFTIVTIPDDPTLMTANMKAPIVINLQSKSARQCVLQDNSLAIKEPIFAKLQQRVVQSPSKSIKEQSQAMDVAIRIRPAQEI